MLVDHPDAVPGDPQLLAAQRGQLEPADRDGAGVRAFQHVDAPEKGALARSAAPQHTEDLALADAEVDTVDSDDGTPLRAVRFT
ncbi:hypothetical protein GCM10025331_69560 [Actinoplanes utahensis]|nr:hypothetical protein Aut01nite_73680 [Actinoplanes utahensis]